MRKNNTTILWTLFFVIICNLFNSPNKLFAADGLTINGYVDMYYATDNDPNAVANRPLLNSLNTQKEAFDINHAMLSFTYLNKDYRSKICIHYGALQRSAWPAYSNANMIQEANVGVNLGGGLWLDAGYFLTHIGCEVITPKDNWFNSLALSTQNEPFFQSGLKLTYDASDKLQLQLHCLNGYNLFDDNNKNKSLGYYVSYKFNDDMNIALAGIYGNEAYLGLPIPINQTIISSITFNHTPKLLNNIVFNYNVSKSILLKASFDLSNQNVDAEIVTITMPQSVPDFKGTSSSLGGFFAARYLLNNELYISVRAEMYNTKYNTENYSSKASNAIGGTLGLEYKPNSNSYIRLEARQLNYEKGALSIKPFDTRNEGIFSFGVYF